MALTKEQKTAVGKAIGATAPKEKVRMMVRVDFFNMGVYDGNRRMGIVQSYTKNEGARTPTGGKFTSHRVTVKLTGDDRVWVGQFKNDVMKRPGRKNVILRLLEDEN